MRSVRLLGLFLALWAFTDDRPGAAQTAGPGKIPPPRPPQAPVRRPVQPPRPWFVYGGASFPALPATFSNSVTFTEFVEQGTRSVDYEVGHNVAFDGGFGFGFRRHRTLFVGASASFFKGTTTGAIDEQIPHPFYFNQARTLQAEVTDLERTELAIHVQVSKRLALSRSAHLVVSGGPSIVWLDQEIITDVDYSQEFPFDEVGFQQALTEMQSRTSFGVNGQADVVYMLSRRSALDAFIRYSYAPVTFDSFDGSTFKSFAGGLQVGLAIRGVF